MNVLTIGLATYRDFDGVYFTLQSLRAHHGNDFDVLVVDNAPVRCVRTEQVTLAVGGKYCHRPDLTGTSKPRDAVFRLATTPWAMVCDSHVLFEPGAIAKLQELSQKPEHARDFLTGPLVLDDGRGISTHWQATTPPGLWGVWQGDPRGAGTEPFDVPMQGLGCFAMSKDAWPGFHLLSRGFGGEEGYVHEKARRAGGRVLCVPQLRWRHRFRDIGGFDKNPTPYPAYLGDHVHNLLVQHRELGIEAEEAIFKDFGSRLAPTEWQRVLAEARSRQPLGETSTVPRQRIVGVWYSDNTAPAPLMASSLRTIATAKQQTWRHDVELVACGWEKPDGLPPEVRFVRYEGERRRSHLTILAQIVQALGASSAGDAACFLEHDVLYPEWYFQRVGDAFAANPGSPVVSNLDYVGLGAQGWQPVRERHEPMHQLSMRWDFAVENVKRATREAESGSALLEPQGDRTNWVQLPPTQAESGSALLKPQGDSTNWVLLPPPTDLGLAPSVHVNHLGTNGAVRFTSHGEVVYAPATKTGHPHWGEHRLWWPHPIPKGEAVPANPGCGACSGPQPVAAKEESLGAWFERAKATPSDFHEHVQTLRNLASTCDHVTQIGIWGKPSRIALAHGMTSDIAPGEFVDYSPAPRPEWVEFKRLMGENFTGKEWPTGGIEIEPTDLLFIDTYHTAEETLALLTRHAPKVRKYLVVHTTEIYGETGDNGGPGVLHGVRRFVHDNREWTVVRQDRNNYGLVVLSRLDEDRKKPPGLMRKALNFTKALAQHAKEGMRLASDEVYETRLELCLLCPERAHDVCAKCGCPIDKKASWAEQQCPDNPPRWLSIPQSV